MPPLLRTPTPDNPSGIGSPGPRVIGPQNPPPAPGQPLSAYQSDAYAYLQSLLSLYGLDSLSGWAYEQVVAGNSPAMVTQLLYQRPEFQTRFPAIFARQKAGLPPLSVAQVLDYEERAIALFRAAGIPPGFYDSHEELQDFIAKDVSLSELSSRIQLAAESYYATDPNIRGELHSLYGITPGEQLTMFLDEDIALPIIERRFTSARLSATAIQTGFGGLTREEAEGLSGLGLTSDAAARGFTTLGLQTELFTPLPGEAGYDITRDEQLRAQFYGNARMQEAIQRRADMRIAQFKGGGDVLTSQQGVVGLRSAQN